MTAELYRELALSRTYFSAFRPIRGTPLEEHEPTPSWREYRLYQADFLLRQYGFAFDELVFDDGGRLPRDADPKQFWAHRHSEFFPVEVNTASRMTLLRIPGIGPASADAILRRRRQGQLRALAHLGLRPATAQQAAPWILLDGHRPAFQPSLWDPLREEEGLIAKARIA